MNSMKRGLVLLSFLSEHQLKGFHDQECKKPEFGTFRSEWETRRKKLDRDERAGEPCVLSEMSQEEDVFVDNPKFNDQYEGRPIRKGWIQNIEGIIPLKPFLAVEDCEQLMERAGDSDDMISICLGASIVRDPISINVSRDRHNLHVSLVTSDRDIFVKGLDKRYDEERDLLQLTVNFGPRSPFIEVIEHNDRVFLVNGLHRLFALVKLKYKEKVPCIILEDRISRRLVQRHPYEEDITSNERPPVLADFFNPDIAFEIELKTGINHLQLFTQETLIPTDV